MVDVQFQRKLATPITLATLRKHSNGALQGLALFKRGNRLSITPVSAAHWKFILSLEWRATCRKVACRASRELQTVQRITLDVRIIAMKMRKKQ